jgi:hypothetical protein
MEFWVVLFFKRDSVVFMGLVNGFLIGDLESLSKMVEESRILEPRVTERRLILGRVDG